jgi:Alpha/beta hydrolase domain
VRRRVLSLAGRHRIAPAIALAVLTALVVVPSGSFASPSASLVPTAAEPYGTFNGVAFVRHTGIFEGETSRGAFRAPFDIIAPEDPAAGNRTVLVEPPHFLLGTAGRDLTLTPELVFGQGSSYAAVGFGTNGLNILDPGVSGLVVAGSPVVNPGAPDFSGAVDEEIIVQFVHALSSDPAATAILGELERRYAYGISQTVEVLLETLYSPGGQGLFDLTLLNIGLWKPPFPPLDLQNLPEEFQPPSGVGRTIFVESEGDLLVSRAEEFRQAADNPSHRVYEVAGAAHVAVAARPFNPLDHSLFARALLVAGDAWVRDGVLPPASTLLETDATGAIVRDADGNARGGVRLPDLVVGRGRYIASIPIEFPPGSGLVGLLGLMIDLACAPEPGSTTGEPRFRNHGDYVGAFTGVTNGLLETGFLLAPDAEAMKEQASQSSVGKPGTCDA